MQTPKLRLPGARHLLSLVAIAALAALPVVARAQSAQVGSPYPQQTAQPVVCVNPTTKLQESCAGAGGPGGGGVTVSNLPALGQTTKAGSTPVTFASDPDFSPSSGNITAADSATSTVAGQSGVTLVTGTPTAGSFQTWALNGHSSATLTVTGTFSATAKIETSGDGGATYGPATGKILGVALTTSSITQPGIFRVDVTGMTNIRVRASAFTSGTLTAKLTASASSGLAQINAPVRVTDSNGQDVWGLYAEPTACPTDIANCTLAARVMRLQATVTALNTKIDTLNGLAAAQTPAGTAVIGGVNISQTTPGTTNGVVTNSGSVVAVPASTTGGVTGYGLQSAALTNSTLISTGAHTLLGITLEDPTTTAGYLRLYDAASAPTCSSATGFIRSFAVPPAAASGGIGGIVLKFPAQGIAYTSGLAFCFTGGAASTDNTSGPAGVMINVDYK